MAVEPEPVGDCAADAYVPLATRPIKRDDAKGFVAKHHRHSKKAVATWRFGTSLIRTDTDEMVGVGIAGNCASREWDKQGGGHFIEVRRVATLGTRNACSMIYGALTRAAKALGFCTAWTYTLTSESGASLLASGWEVYAVRSARGGWDCASRPRDEDGWPAEAKVLWIKRLNPCAEHEVSHPLPSAVAA